MATVTAKATGNWSAGSTWDSDPALPAAGDTVDCAGYVVTVDQDVAVVQMRSSGAGYFAVTAARNITAAILSVAGHSGGGVVRCSHATGTVEITGSVTGGANRGVDVTGAGTVNITGNVTGGSAANAEGLQNSSTGTVNITGNVAGAPGINARGVYNVGTGTVNITGNASGGSGVTAYAYGAWNNSTGTMTVSGVCYGGGNENCYGLHGRNAGGTTTFKRAVFGNANGAPVGGFVKLVVDQTVNYCEMPRSDTGAAYQLSNDYPTEAQVESGVVYKLGTLTGTLVAGGGGGRRPRLWSLS